MKEKAPERGGAGHIFGTRSCRKFIPTALWKFSENAEAGDHYTGRDIIKLMVNILLAEGCDDIFDDGKVVTILEKTVA